MVYNLEQISGLQDPRSGGGRRGLPWLFYACGGCGFIEPSLGQTLLGPVPLTSPARLSVFTPQPALESGRREEREGWDKRRSGEEGGGGGGWRPRCWLNQPLRTLFSLLPAWWTLHTRGGPLAGPLAGPHVPCSAGAGPWEDDVDLSVLHALGRFLLLYL